MPKIISKDTTWSGTVNLTADVQVSAGATLTVAAGTIINGHGHTMAAIGKIDVKGTAANYSQLNNVHLNAIDGNGAQVGLIYVNHTFINGGGLLDDFATGELFVGISSSVITGWDDEPWLGFGNSAVFLDSIFANNKGLSAWSIDGPVELENNLFLDTPITVSSADQLGLSGNSFISTSGRTVLFGEADFSASGSWFGTTSASRIQAMIEDSNDDLSLGSIDVSLPLSQPNSHTPPFGTGSANTFAGSSRQDFYFALGGNDTVFGASNDDYLDGGKGTDSVRGGKGNDTILGGGGKDVLSGNDGKDRFVFTAGHSGNSIKSRDVITDFVHGVDKIDLHSFSLAVDPIYGIIWKFIAKEGAAFTKDAFDFEIDQIRWDQQKLPDGHWRTAIYTTGDDFEEVAPFQIEITGKITLTASDFVF